MAGGINGFSVGKDLSVQIVVGGVLTTFAGTTAAEARPMYNERNSHGLDGINRHIPIPSGWEGSMEVDRTDDSVSSLFAAQEAGYYAGAGIPASTVEQTINNPDGSITIYQFTGVMLTLREDGNWRGDDKVQQRIDWRASQRTQLS